MSFFMQDKNRLFIFKFWYVNSRSVKKYTPYIHRIYFKGVQQQLTCLILLLKLQQALAQPEYLQNKLTQTGCSQIPWLTYVKRQKISSWTVNEGKQHSLLPSKTVNSINSDGDIMQYSAQSGRWNTHMLKYVAYSIKSKSGSLCNSYLNSYLSC